MLTIIIPTLQKSVSTLELLLRTLNDDDAVGEIIVVDNSLKGLDINLAKLRVITPNENLYVNPSWNLGVQEAKFEKIGLLNDDIAIPKDFCTNIEKYITENIGIIGGGPDSVIPQNQIDSLPKSSSLLIEPVKCRNFNYGIAMFFHKKSYFMIPDDIKIFFGDDWIFVKNLKNKKENFVVTNCELYHLGSLTSGEPIYNSWFAADKEAYLKNIRTWYEYIFSFEITDKHYKIKFLGITFSIKKHF